MLEIEKVSITAMAMEKQTVICFKFNNVFLAKTRMKVPTYMASGKIQSSGADAISVVMKVVTPNMSEEGRKAVKTQNPRRFHVMCSSTCAGRSFAFCLEPCTQIIAADKTDMNMSRK